MRNINRIATPSVRPESTTSSLQYVASKQGAELSKSHYENEAAHLDIMRFYENEEDAAEIKNQEQAPSDSSIAIPLSVYSSASFYQHSSLDASAPHQAHGASRNDNIDRTIPLPTGMPAVDFFVNGASRQPVNEAATPSENEPLTAQDSGSSPIASKPDIKQKPSNAAKDASELKHAVRTDSIHRINKEHNHSFNSHEDNKNVSSSKETKENKKQFVVNKEEHLTVAKKDTTREHIEEINSHQISIKADNSFGNFTGALRQEVDFKRTLGLAGSLASSNLPISLQSEEPQELATEASEATITSDAALNTQNALLENGISEITLPAASGQEETSSGITGYAPADLTNALPESIAMALRSAKFSDFLDELASSVETLRLNSGPTGTGISINLSSNALEETNVLITAHGQRLDVAFSTMNNESNALLNANLSTLQNRLVATWGGQAVDIRTQLLPGDTSSLSREAENSEDSFSDSKREHQGKQESQG